jgi:mannose-6-phosphate isomerase-like protein (cupin superfamily)
MDRVNLAEKCALIQLPFTPHLVGELNGQHVKLARLEGAFDWHHHADEDELFLVLEGRFRMEYRDRSVTLEAGEMCIVPRGIEHRPVADAPCYVLLFEPAGTLNTGNVRSGYTVEQIETI